MKDFSLIEVDINFLDGVYVHVADERNPSYALEIYEKFDKEWAIIWSREDWSPYHWFRHSKKMRNSWRVKIWGWENDSPKLLTCETYNEEGKKICLEFIHDSYSTHKKWADLSVSFSRSNRCNVFVVSRFSERLEKDFNGEGIEFFPPVSNWGVFFRSYEIYSKFTISKSDIPSKTEDWWDSGSIFENHANPIKTWDHRNDWVGMNDEQIFKDIMGYE